MFFFSGNNSYIIFNKRHGLQTFHPCTKRAKWGATPYSLFLYWVTRGLEGSVQPIETPVPCLIINQLLPHSSNLNTDLELLWLLTPNSIISLNDMVLELVLRKGNQTHIWKRLGQRGRVESAWWEKYK